MNDGDIILPDWFQLEVGFMFINEAGNLNIIIEIEEDRFRTAFFYRLYNKWWKDSIYFPLVPDENCYHENWWLDSAEIR